MPRKLSRPDSGGNGDQGSSASLKVLPPEGYSGGPAAGATAASEVVGSIVGTAAAHWKLNPRDRTTPVRKSVSLKLGKAALGSPTASQCGGPGDLVSQPLQQQHRAPARAGGSLPPPPARQESPALREKPRSARREADGPGAGQKPLPLPSRGHEPQLEGLSLSSTAPATVGRPPAGASTGMPLGGRPPPAPGRKADYEIEADEGKVFAPLHQAPPTPLPRGSRGARALLPAGSPGSSRPPSSSSQSTSAAAAMPMSRAPPSERLAAVLAASAAAGGGSRTIGASSFDVEEELAPPVAPRIAWSEGADGPGGDADDGDADAGFGGVSELAQQIRREFLARRVAGDAYAKQAAMGSEGGADSEARIELETQVGRRSAEALESSLAGARARAEKQRQELDGYLEALRQRRFQADAEGVSATSAAAAATAAASGTAGEDEPLISMPEPAEFDDIVDLNMQLASMRRRISSASGRRRGTQETPAPEAPTGGGAGGSSSSSASVSARLPSFMDKYLFADKAAEQLPHLALEAATAAGAGASAASAAGRDGATGVAALTDTPEDPNGVLKLARQIERLNDMLARCEAEGATRVQAARRSLDAVKERAKREAADANDEKMQVLRKLKEKGLLGKNDRGAPTALASRAASAASAATSTALASRSSAPSARSSVSGAASSTLVVVEAPASPSASALSLMDWSGWTSSVAVEEASAAPTPSASDARRQAAAAAEASQRPATPGDDGGGDLDSTTFLLTATTSRILGPEPVSSTRPSFTGTLELAPLPEEGVLAAAGQEDPEALGADADVSDEYVAALEDEIKGLEEAPDDETNPYSADVEALEAIRNIDEKLRRMVPERDWEAKSLSSMPSLPMLCAATSKAASKAPRSSAGSQARSVWSRAASDEASVPGEAVLRDQYETRESAKALAAIDGRLEDLKTEALVHANKPASPEELRKLLMEVAQEAQPLDATTKVLALTGQEALSVATPASRFADNVPLQKAKKLLMRLRGGAGDADLAPLPQEASAAGAEEPFTSIGDALGEAALSLQQLDSDVRALEHSLATNARTAQPDALPGPAQGRGGPTVADTDAGYPSASVAQATAPSAAAATTTADAAERPASAMAPIVARLEDLSRDVLSCLEKRLPIEELPASAVAPLPDLPAEEDELDAGGAADTLDDMPAEGAGGWMDDWLQDSSLDHALLLGRPNSDVAEDAGNVRQALSVELPAGDGPWDDAELERICGAVDAHFGDKVPTDWEAEPLPPLPTAGGLESDSEGEAR